MIRRLLQTVGLARRPDDPSADESARAFGATRSPQWPAERDRWRKDHPQCACCKARHDLDVHHKRPFHLHPELELARTNLMTLCRRCHLFVGHLGDWASYNPHVETDAEIWMRKITTRPAVAGGLLAVVLVALVTAAARVQAGDVTAFSEGTAASPDGKVEVTCDLPAGLRLQNTGGIGPRGPGTGAGLCVFTSTEHCGRWQNIAELIGLQAKMTHEPGGGYPEKVVAMLKKHAPGVVENCLQHTGGDVEWLKAALATGRMLGVTYCGHDPRYGNQTIAHMVNLVYLDDRWACILDNNSPGKYLWMTAAEFIERWKGETADGKKFMIRDGGRLVPVGGAWALCFDNPPPAPVPRVK